MPYISLLNEHKLGNEFLWSNYGMYKGWVFRGDHAFIERSKLLLKNYGILREGKLTELYDSDPTRGAFYVLTLEERVLEGLSVYFIYEILTECKDQIDYKLVEIDECPEPTWDETKQAELAVERAKLFWESHVKRDNFLAERHDDKRNDVHEFEISSIVKGFKSADNWTTREDKSLVDKADGYKHEKLEPDPVTKEESE